LLPDFQHLLKHYETLKPQVKPKLTAQD
jgi:hypothetical protein